MQFVAVAMEPPNSNEIIINKRGDFVSELCPPLSAAVIEFEPEHNVEMCNHLQAATSDDAMFMSNAIITDVQCAASAARLCLLRAVQ